MVNLLVTRILSNLKTDIETVIIITINPIKLKILKFNKMSQRFLSQRTIKNLLSLKNMAKQLLLLNLILSSNKK